MELGRCTPTIRRLAAQGAIHPHESLLVDVRVLDTLPHNGPQVTINTLKTLTAEFLRGRGLIANADHPNTQQQEYQLRLGHGIMSLLRYPL
jgi:hypothetical protein